MMMVQMPPLLRAAGHPTLEPNVKLSAFSVRAVMVLALTILAGCNDDSTGVDTSVGGSYALESGLVFSFDDAQTTRKPVPIVLYEGPASNGSATFNIRFELLGSTMTLEESGRTFQFSGTYRLSETANRFQPQTETFTASGTYSVDGSDITFAPAGSSEVGIGSDGLLYRGKLSVEVTDPFLGLETLYEFRK
ncbi:MAG TPA: hypothetical protein VF613_19345 [Longimicrobium sp.]